MEKEPLVKQAETAMDQAAADVRQAITEYADAAFFHVCKMTEQGEDERMTMITSDNETNANYLDAARATRVSRIPSFRQDAQKAINALELSPENATKAQSWLATKLSNCANVETVAAKAIKDKLIADTLSITSIETQRRKVIDGQIVDIATRLKQNKFDMTWSSLSQYATNKAASIESMLDNDKEALSNRLRTKRQELKALIERKDIQQKELLTSYDTQLKNLLDRLSTSQGQKKSSQQQTGTNSGHRASEQSGGFKQNHHQEDSRVKTLMGKDTDSSKRPYKIVLVNIDHHRKKDKSDAEIYRLLVKNFHPDKSDHEHAETIIRILTSSYDSKKKKFVI